MLCRRQAAPWLQLRFLQPLGGCGSLKTSSGAVGANCFSAVQPDCHYASSCREEPCLQQAADHRAQDGGASTIPHEAVARPVLTPQLPLATLGPGCRASSSWRSPASGRQAPAETCLLRCLPADGSAGAGRPRPPQLLRAAPESEAHPLPIPLDCSELHRPPWPAHYESASAVMHPSAQATSKLCRQYHSVSEIGLKLPFLSMPQCRTSQSPALDHALARNQSGNLFARLFTSVQGGHVWCCSSARAPS